MGAQMFSQRSSTKISERTTRFYKMSPKKGYPKMFAKMSPQSFQRAPQKIFKGPKVFRGPQVFRVSKRFLKEPKRFSRAPEIVPSIPQGFHNISPRDVYRGPQIFKSPDSRDRV